jgi:hypothetical protein
MIELFVAFRTAIAQRRMKPVPVVERLDVVEEVRTRPFADVLRAVVHALAVRRAEEALHRGTIGPDVDAIHAYLDSPVVLVFVPASRGKVCERGLSNRWTAKTFCQVQGGGHRPDGARIVGDNGCQFSPVIGPPVFG